MQDIGEQALPVVGRFEFEVLGSGRHGRFTSSKFVLH